MAAGTLTRRAAIQGAAGVAAGFAAAAARPQGAVAHDHGHGRLPVPPEPIPGGIPISETQVIHVWPPGPTDVDAAIQRRPAPRPRRRADHDPGLQRILGGRVPRRHRDGQRWDAL